MSSSSTRDIVASLQEAVVPSGGTRRGLVVGIEKYRDERLNLRCARKDAQAIYNLMTDPDCGMFPKDNVRLLLDADATKDKVWRALATLRRNAGAEDTVWIYYAGHGAPEGKHTYWVTHDADVDDLYGTALSGKQIAEVLGDLRAKRLLVLLDCCHAAATTIQRNPSRATLTAEEVFSQYQGQGRVTLSSSDGKQKSVELGDEGHGAFTYFLEKGLRGEADKDGNGVVTAEELWEYLRGKVADASQKAGNPQTPVLMGEMTHDLALTLNPLAVTKKMEKAQAIEKLIGLGEERLSTDEAELCLQVLRHGPRSPDEYDIEAEIEALIAGTTGAATFKRLVGKVLLLHGTPPPPPPPPPPDEPLKSLLNAAHIGNVVEIQRHIAARADLSLRDKDGNTPLHLAANMGHEDAVCELVNGGAQVNVRNNGGATPLHLAAAAGRPARCRIVNSLLTANADVNARTNLGWTPLLRAAAAGKMDVAALLLDKGADVNACEGENGFTSLHYAAWRGDRAFTVLLLHKGADKDSLTRGGFAALQLAERKGHVPVSRLLKSYSFGVRQQPGDCV